MPAGTPHFRYADLNPASGDVAATEVGKIVQKAFDIHHRDYVDRLLDEFGRLRDLAHQHDIELNNVDPRRMIFSLTLPGRLKGIGSDR